MKLDLSAVALYRLAVKEILWQASFTPDFLSTTNRSLPELVHGTGECDVLPHSGTAYVTSSLKYIGNRKEQDFHFGCASYS